MRPSPLLLTGGVVAISLGSYVIFRSLTSTSKPTQKNEPKNFPPSPDPTDPNLGNIGDMGAAGSLHEYLTLVHTKYNSDVISFWYGTTRVVSIKGAAAFKCHQRLFDRPQLLFALFEPLLTPHSIQYANAEDGRRRRRLYDKFFSHEACLKMIPVFNEVSDRFICKLWQTIEKSETKSAVFDVGFEMIECAIQAVTEACFGDYFADEERRERLAKSYHFVWDAMENCLLHGSPEVGSDADNEFKLKLKELQNLFRDLLEHRKKNPPRNGNHLFVDELIETWEEQEDVALADIISYAIGGFHTSGNALLWTLYYIAMQPGVQERVAAETRVVLGKPIEMGQPLGDAYISYDQTQQLKYTKQVLNESLRISCLAPMAARVDHEVSQILGYTIPPGTPIVHALGVSLIDHSVWKDPEIFDPDRFDDSNSDLVNSLAFSPFGFAGKRKCPGYRFSYLEQILWLGKWVNQFEFTVHEKTVNVEKVYHLVTSPKNPIYLTVSCRN